MRISNQVFHTRHDFSPELAWSAFQLLQSAGDGMTQAELEELAPLVASPLAVRSDYGKILSSLQDLGLVRRQGDQMQLSDSGHVLASGVGRFEDGFRKAIHCLYFWQWIWSKEDSRATPSWSFGEVSRRLLAAGPVGVDRDELVLAVVTEASRFGVDRVSFSRSSVSGVTMWLEAQRPTLVHRTAGRIVAEGTVPPSAGAIRLHLAALCRNQEGTARLDEPAEDLLSAGLVTRWEILAPAIRHFCAESKEFTWTGRPLPRVVFVHSDDRFVAWLATGNG